MANRVSIEIGASETASPVVEKVRATTERNMQQIRRSGVILDQYGRSVDSTSRAMESQAGAARNSAGQANQLEKEFAKLTSGTEFVAQGVQGLRGALNSIVWGTVIGAVTAVVSKLIEYAIAAKNSAVDTDQLNKTVLDGSVKYGLLAQSQRDVTETTVRLFNAELELAQFRAVRDQAAIQEKIKALEDENRVKAEARRRNAELLESMEANHPLYLSTVAAFTKQSETILENNLEIAKLTNREADLKKIMDLKKISLEDATKATGKLTKTELEQESKGRNIQAEAVKAYHDRRAAQEQLGRSILAAAQAQAAEKAATQEAMGRSIQMAAVLDQQRLAEERLLEAEKMRSTTVVDPTAQIFANMERNIAIMDQFLIQQQALSGAFGPIPQQIAEMNLELERSIEIGQVAAGAVGTLINAITAMGIAGQFSGKAFAAAMLGFVAQTLASLSVMATSKAIESLAWAQYAQGLALLGHPGAAAAATQFYASAAFWGKVAAVSGVAAIGTGIAAGRLSADARGGGGSGGGGGTSTGDLRDSPEESRRNGPLEVYVFTLHPSLVDHDRLVREYIAPATGRHIRDGGDFDGIIIHHERR